MRFTLLACCALCALASTSTASPTGDSHMDVAKRQSPPPPPTKPGCVAHEDHFDCDDGGWCELNAEGTAWECFDVDGNLQNADGTPVEGSTGGGQNPDGSGEEHHDEEGAGGGECVVHGGHTHGDCSNNCGGIDTGAYDERLHIASVFIILVSSLVGVGLPILLRPTSAPNTAKVSASTWQSSPILAHAFFAVKHFGTGIIISTAFVHLLYHAFVMFSNSCIRGIVFEPVAPAIAMGSTYFVFLVDLVGMRWIRARVRQSTTPAVTGAAAPGDNTEKARQVTVEPTSSSSSVEVTPQLAPPHHHHHESETPTTDYSSRQAHFDVMLLEAGIIFHSIMIGVTLGATGGSEWVPLLCAITFHQMFEGLGLGSRVAMLEWVREDGTKDPKGEFKRWVMAVAFGFITPVGIAIGIGVHRSYNPNSNEALLSIGILDSISAGILLYVGLVELLAHDFLFHGSSKSSEGSAHSHSHGPGDDLGSASNRRVAGAVGYLMLGTFCMTLLGRWA